MYIRNRTARAVVCAAAALLLSPSVRAAEPVTVSDLSCSQISCETGRGFQPHMVTVEVSGKSSRHAGTSLTLAVIDWNKKVIFSQPAVVGADGAFAAAIPAYNLPPGSYRFGFVTQTTPATGVAGGSFTVGGSAGAFAAEPVKAVAAAPVNAAPAAPARTGSAGFYFRTFGLAIPGVAYTTDNYATNTRTTTVSSGVVTKSSVRVNSDGTYIWNSAWDGKIIQGRWRNEGAAIVLMSAQGGLNWRMERLAQPSGKAVVSLWDQNSIWYHGTPLE